jgi:hypothetical protein
MRLKYLYGASVQGIQGFIFETNKLKEIAGASELVEQICTSFFKAENPNFQKENLIVRAAGNIKYVFDDINDCQHFVRKFPKQVTQKAAGITISQAVVEYDGVLESTHIEELEKRLRVQRNKPIVQHGMGLMITERSRRTGKSGVVWDGKDVIDAAQKNKRPFSENAKNNLLKKLLGQETPFKSHQFPHDIADIVQKKDQEWIAVVHADGNNLGKLILEMSTKLAPQKTKSAFKEFSTRLENATIASAAEAFDKVVREKALKLRHLPIRPVILGGDDLTIIIRGDLALDYTHHYLEAFERNTKAEFSEFGKKYGLTDFDNGLTACAGIAYIKPTYPFHYGVNLSEELCKHSKNIAKEINSNKTPSCITFHQVLSSFIDNYKDIVEQELSAKDIRFDYGPYFIHEEKGFATVKDLKEWSRIIQKEGAPKSPLRNWLGSLQVNEKKASQELERIRNLNPRYINSLGLKEPFPIRVEKSKNKAYRYTHLFDVLRLSTIEKVKAQP